MIPRLTSAAASAPSRAACGARPSARPCARWLKRTASRAEARERLARHRELGGWVEPRAGLCCYAYFDTLEEALAAAPDAVKLVSGDLGASELASLYVFEGELLPQDSLDDGRVFRPTGRYWLVRERE